MIYLVCLGILSKPAAVFRYCLSPLVGWHSDSESHNWSKHLEKTALFQEPAEHSALTLKGFLLQIQGLCNENDPWVLCIQCAIVKAEKTDDTGGKKIN